MCLPYDAGWAAYDDGVDGCGRCTGSGAEGPGWAYGAVSLRRDGSSASMRAGGMLPLRDAVLLA